LRSGEVAIVIPALNEAESITAVVSSVSAFGTPIVVDDGSIDETAKLATEAGAHVVRHFRNRGYDAALSTGMYEARKTGFEFVITVDADGQHMPLLIGEFKSALLNGADLVIGVRDRRQRFSETIFSWVGKFLWNVRDPLCGMKAYRLTFLDSFGPFSSFKSVGTEFAIRQIRNGIKPVEIFVPTRPRVGVPRFGGTIKANYRIFRAMVILVFSKA